MTKKYVIPITLSFLSSVSTAQTLNKADFIKLAEACSPKIHTSTMLALAKSESSLNPYAINVNGSHQIKKQPKSKEEAVSLANQLLSKGLNIDVGIAQINSGNFESLGVSTTELFDVCTNLKTSQTILVDCFRRASKKHTKEHEALKSALSCYNTGNFTTGRKNGYVSKVYSNAGVVVPAPSTDVYNPNKSITLSAAIARKMQGRVSN